MEQGPDPIRQGRLQRRYQEGAENAQLPPQVSPTVTNTWPPQILSTPSQRSRDASPVLVQTPHIDYEGTLVAREGIRTTTLVSASPLPPTASNKIHPLHHPTVGPEFNLQYAARQSTASEFQDKVLRNKIIAFNKLVTATVHLPANTIEHLVNKLSKTMEDLLQVPGILPFANACSRANHDLLGFLIKCATATR